MSSDESDDEPLSVLAAAKKLNPDKFAEETLPKNDAKSKKKKKKALSSKKISLTIKINRKLKHTISPQIIKRPMDVWLYMKDLNPTGPYSCLLCSEWFINRSKIIVHYVLNHKKDFCGICRYFVPDRAAWWAHVKFHTPWPCSQCVDNFQSESALRQHLNSAHKLVHCRLCHFRVSADDQYKTHLFQKHNVTNVSSKDEENLWELDYEGSNKFLCLLCSKSNNLTSTFFNHYMGYHHFTLKCFTSIISGRDPPFLIDGAEVSPDFIDGQLKDQVKFGYVDLDQQKSVIGEHESESGNSDTNVLLNALIPEIKQEPTSETEEDVKNEIDVDIKISPEKDPSDITNTYKGDEDFDVTLTELIILQKCYYDYVSQTLNSINSKEVPTNSNVIYEDIKSDAVSEMTCDFCNTIHNSTYTLTLHMNRMHSIKSVPAYSCRVCATTFENQSELDNHTKTELGEFDDLWICQFCDKEFDNRESTRQHLTEHWEELQYENCFSPHVGFKCKFCPVLFWNETDRETHQVRVHYNKHKVEFYKCVTCSNVYGDKIWFTHHYLDKHCDDEMKKESIYLLKCCICCVVMPSVHEMRNHFETEHLEARKVFCSMGTCQYKPLSHRKSFKFHLRSVHNPTSRPERAVNCAICGKEFVSARACGAHMSQVHGPGKYKCKLCKEVLHTMDERKLHYLIRHPGRHPFECTECGKSFQYKSSLYMHKQEHAPNKQSYTCNYCGKVFMKKDSFREHVQIHEGPRHACSYCPMRFVQRSNMLRHERRHTGERPYACPHCARTFADKGACTSHARTHSRDTSYACVYCGQTFVQKSKLTYHIRKHTGENLETCTVCSKLFTSGCALREHMKIHSKERETAKCPLCERVYQDERSMIRHLRTAHARAHYSCPLCPKALTSASGLRHHVLTHSRINTFQCKSCPKSYAVKKSIIKHLRRRHGLKDTEHNIKEYFKRLDPRECELGLEEDVMTNIFGPPKKTSNDVLIGNYVTLTNKFTKDIQNNEDDGEDDENDEQSDEEDDENDDFKRDAKDSKTTKYNQIKVEITKDSGGEEELEPTDFVSVKIEPIDEYEYTD